MVQRCGAKDGFGGVAGTEKYGFFMKVEEA